MIVALGDSTTAGTPGWMSPREFPPKGRGDDRSQYAYWLMHAHPEWTVVNQGINGQRSDEIAARFDADVAALRPSLVVIIAGVNDIYQGRPAPNVITQLDAMYRRAAEHGIQVVAGTILPYDTATPEQNARMREVNAWITSRAESDPNVRVADTRAAVASSTDPDRLASTPDGLHPDADGYRRMAAAIEAQIEGHRRTQTDSHGKTQKDTGHRKTQKNTDTAEGKR
ncbi:MAG TPA: GDSL-type esterase/lipase family protein [Gemmatimonadales bacterium]|nr:GDSL-type esterase/lipase family protein [Gemmatimonadales bacterium]